MEYKQTDRQTSQKSVIREAGKKEGSQTYRHIYSKAGKKERQTDGQLRQQSGKQAVSLGGR